MCTISASLAQEMYVIEQVNMDNFWQKNGTTEQKVLSVGHKILHDNKIDRRIPIVMDRSLSSVNANSSPYYKTVTVYYGILPYIDNDDELAYILAHEIAHSREAYGGWLKYQSMKWNSKKYELDADITGIDYMVKAGYNPVAALTMANKIFPEPLSDFGFWVTHPKGSTRLMNMYSYIYRKYPQYLSSSMTKDVNYVNFRNTMSKEIRGFEQKEAKRKARQNGDI